MQNQHLAAIRAAHWQTRAQFSAQSVPPGLRPWLFDAGSLTRRLVQASAGQFRVSVVDQRWGRATPEEARLLHIDPRQVCRLREVLLFGADTPWVFARSVLPESSLRGSSRFLRHLQSRPLGALLFQSPQTTREHVDYARLTGNDFPGCDLAETIWGRRSVFRFHHHPLLVGEYFLPVMAAQRFPTR